MMAVGTENAYKLKMPSVKRSMTTVNKLNEETT